VNAGVRRFLARLADLFSSGRADREVAREIEAHAALIEDDLRRRGMPPEAARREARLALGGIEQTKERHRDARAFVWIDDARRDVAYAWRVIRRSPAFAATAIVSLAIGIGANSAIFSIANALLFPAPSGVVEPERLVDVGVTSDGRGFNGSYVDYLDVRERATAFEAVYASRLFGGRLTLTDPAGGVEAVVGQFVSMNFFTALGATPAAGRLFGAGDSESPGGSPVVVLSHRFWSRRFNRDPSVVGRTLRLDDQSFTVVGVAADGFHGTRIVAGDLWLPLTMLPAIKASEPAALTTRRGAWLVMGGRLKPGVTRGAAAAELDAVAIALEREYPDDNHARRFLVTASSPIPGGSVPVAIFLVLLMGLVTLVLIAACANLAGLLLARASARRQEIAVRLAIGAARGRLIRQLMTETFVLFAVAAGAGLILAALLTRSAAALLPALPFPVDVSFAIDRRVVAFTSLLALAAALCSGVLPALRASKIDVMSAAKGDAPLGRARLRGAFVAAQVAVSLVLVVSAGLFIRALRTAGAADPGFDPANVELTTIDLSMAGYTAGNGPLAARAVRDRVRALPAVRAATIAVVVPGGFEGQRRGVSVPGLTPAPSGSSRFGVDWNMVEPGYFATLGIPLAEGRDFSDADGSQAARVAIVSESTARQFWPGQRAIGRSIVQPVFGPGGAVRETRTLLVIGVARDVKSSRLIDGFATSFVYVPLQQDYFSRVMIVTRATDGRRVSGDVRGAVGAMNPSLPILSSQTLDDSMALGLIPQRVVATLAGSLGLVGVLLAAIGIYGVTAYHVERRTREIGIRIALGATPHGVVRMVLAHGFSIVGAGTAAGLLFAAGASRLLAGFLFGVPPFDAALFGGATAAFAVIALAACYVPARIATRISAMEALRCD